MSGARDRSTGGRNRRPPKVILLDQVVAATKQTDARPGAGPAQDADRAGARRHRHLRQERDAHLRPRDRGDRSQAVRAAHRDHAPPEVLRSSKARWRGLHYLVMNSETSTSLKLKVLNVSEARAVQGPGARGRVRPEPDLQEALRERVRHARRRALRRADRRLRVHATIPKTSTCCGKMSNVAAAAFCPFISAAGAKLFGFDSWHRAVQAARPGEDLRDASNTPSGERSATPRTRASSPWSCRACWRGCPTARRPSRSRSSTSKRRRTTRPARRSPMPHDDYCWMNAAYVMGTRLTDAFAQVRLLHRHPRRGRRRQGRGPAGPHLHQRRRRPGPEVPDRDRHHRPPRGGADASSASCRCATTRTPTTRCSSAPRSTQKPKKYDRPEATANAAISARLPYIMATVAVRPLPEGDGPRQDRLVHGSGRLSRAG